MSKERLKTKNRKANFLYEFDYKLECGIALKGKDVSSWRKNGLPSLSESYAHVQKREVFVKNLGEEKKLLLHRKEINKVGALYSTSGMVIIPLEIHENENGKFKLVIGVGRKLKLYDQRHKLKERDEQRKIRKEINF